MNQSVQLELSHQEMRDLAEMAAMTLTVMGQTMPDSKDPRLANWQKLCVDMLNAAQGTPGIGRDMELNPDCGYWFFKRPYVENSFFSELLDEYRDSSFWAELVARMAEQVLAEMYSPEQLELMSDEKREAAVSSYQRSLWNEVSQHGIDRLMFLMPPNES